MWQQYPYEGTGVHVEGSGRADRAIVSPACHRRGENVCGSSIHARAQVSMLRAAGVEIGPVSALFVIGQENMSVAAVSMQGDKCPC